ncbi:hypothetical protein Q8F55_000016 [Vanrija albida]|uniref:Uncharacterized protein n=1 Tax=Vanrija albida TaxID=181172 RepID=A0ABR3QC40_9TREE
MSTDVHLDHTSFPNIIDLVIGGCNISALLKWRLTSSSFRARVDRILLNHVVPTAGPPRSTTAKDGIRLTPGSTSRAPPMPPYASLQFYPEAVQILDVWYKPNGKVSDYGLERLTSVCTIRRKGKFVAQRGTNQVPSATTGVDFFDPRNVPNRYRGRPRNKTIIWLPTHLKRYCLHVEWYERESSVLSATVGFKSTKFIRDWVLILHPERMLADGPRCHESYPPFIGDILTHILKVLDRKGSVTIVGTEAASPVQFGEGSTGSATDLLRATVVNLIHQDFPAGPKRTHAETHTTFLTLPAWLDSLGDTKEIEGMWENREPDWELSFDSDDLICPDCCTSFSYELDQRQTGA